MGGVFRTENAAARYFRDTSNRENALSMYLSG